MVLETFLGAMLLLTALLLVAVLGDDYYDNYGLHLDGKFECNSFDQKKIDVNLRKSLERAYKGENCRMYII